MDKPTTTEDGTVTPAAFGVPKNPDGTIDKQRVRELYMAAKEIDFQIFVRSRGWSETTAYEVPHAEWKKEKRAILGRRAAESLADAIFDHKFDWHKDVLRTLKELPKLHDTQLDILKFAQIKILEIMKETQHVPADQKRVTRKNAQGEIVKDAAGFFNRIKISDLVAMSVAISQLTTSKHRSLLLDKWSMKVAEDHAVPEAADEAADVTRPDADWKIELIGVGEVGAVEMAKLVQKYFDPAHMPASPSDADRRSMDESAIPESPESPEPELEAGV